LSLLITAYSNSFLAIILDSTLFLFSQQAGVPKLDSSLHSTTVLCFYSFYYFYFSSDLLCPFIAPRRGPHGKHLCIVKETLLTVT
jgi:hypothetical protein